MTKVGCAGCLFGLLLHSVAFCILLGLAVLPVIFENNSTLMDLQETVYCSNGETFVQDFHTQTDLRGTVRGGQIYCVDASGNQRNVTGKAFLYAGVGFAVPFVVGLLLLIGGSAALTGSGVRGVLKRAKTQPTTSGAPPLVVRMNHTGTAPRDFSPENPEEFQQLFDVIAQQADRAGINSANDTLSERLRQLEDARSANMISSEEYERLRREILDNMIT